MDYWVSPNTTLPVPNLYAPLMARKGANRDFTSQAATCGMWRNNTIIEATNRVKREAQSRAVHEKKRLRISNQLEKNMARIQKMQAKLHQTQEFRVTIAVANWAACTIQFAWSHHKAKVMIRLITQNHKLMRIKRWLRLQHFLRERRRAAACLQRYYRGWKGRILMADLVKKTAAAAKIQAVMRGILGQRKVIRHHQSVIAVCVVVREAILFGAARAFFTVNAKNDAATSIQRTLLAAWKRKKLQGRRGRMVLQNRRRTTQRGEKPPSSAALAERRQKAQAVHRARRALLRCVTGARIIYSLGKVRPWGQRMHSSVNFQDGAQISSLPELAIFEESDEVIRRRTLAKKNRDRRLQQQNSIDRSPSLGKTVQGRARRPSMMKSVASPSSPQRQPRAPDGFASSAQARRPQVGSRVIK